MTEPTEDVIRLFEKFALDLVNAGVKKYSARAIIHRIRWHYAIERGDPDFKCNNNWTPKMARDFIKKYPAYTGFFETRRSPGTVPCQS